MHDSISFLMGGRVETVSGVDPNLTLLQYLRTSRRLCGTKEGCAEGDCGACTVVVAEVHGNVLCYHALNSCLVFLGTLDGKQVITVEDLRSATGELHPVQQALVDFHGSQCGFCTPGIILSLFALFKSDPSPTRRSIEDALVGNLCRCTGYRSILDAALALSGKKIRDHFDENEAQTIHQLRALASIETLVLEKEGRSFYLPRSKAELSRLCKENPSAILLAGGTDLGLQVTKNREQFQKLISVSEVPELLGIQVEKGAIHLGAAVSYSQALPIFLREIPSFGELLLRLGSRQIRNLGTLGGNIANASPIGDSLPSLVSLGSRIILTSSTGSRELPLGEFFQGYRQTAIRPSEYIEKLIIPLPSHKIVFRTYKLSKRFDQDISTLCGAYCLGLDGNKVQSLSICYGGMAALPKRANHLENALVGKDWTLENVKASLDELDQDYKPLSDFRGSSEYRKLASKNLFLRFFLESTGDSEAGGVLGYE
jgi:xanthine dehydrogenase small subunit